MPENILGLDIQPDAINAVLLKSSLKSSEIISHARVPITATEDSDGWKAAVDALIQQIDVKGAISIASFPSEKLSFRNIQIPFKESKKIRQMLPFELEPSLICPVDQIILDYQVIKKDAPADIIAASVEISDMQAYWERMRVLTEPEIVAVEAVSTLLCLLELEDSPENGIFLTIAPEKAVLIIFAEKTIHLIRKLNIPSNSPSYAEGLCSAVKHTLLVFDEIFYNDFEAEKIFITGSACELSSEEKTDGKASEKIEEKISELLSLPLSPINLAESYAIQLEDSLKDKWTPYLMDNALALALLQDRSKRGFNLRQGPFAVRRRMEEYRKEIIKSAVGLAAVLIAALSSIAIDNHYLDKELNNLNSEIIQIFKETLPEVPKIIDPVRQMQDEIELLKQSFMVPGEKEANYRVIDIVNAISLKIPKSIDVKLNRLAISADDIQISGDTDTFNSVDEMKNKLEESDIFSKVTISSADTARTGNRIRFKMKLEPASEK